MRLIKKTILYYLIVILPLLGFSGYFGYTLVKKEVTDATDEYLWKEKLNAEKIILNQQISDVFYLSTDSLSKIIPVSVNDAGHIYGDTKLYDEVEEEILDFRVLKSYCKFKNQNFLITITKSTVEDDDLIESLLKAFGLIAIFMILAFLVLSWFLSKTLWKPFYKTVKQLSDYDLKNHEPLKFDSSSVKEFEQLNLVLNQMTEKIYLDYRQQKEFTENASHEMQTPLAVIKANLNLLMQSQNLKQEDMQYIETLDNTVRKLSALNKALLLLSKIENDQFTDRTSIHLKELILRILKNNEEATKMKSLIILTVLDEKAVILMNPTLAEVLVGNLVQNAMRHTDNSGKIDIILTVDSLIVANNGSPLKIDQNDLFTRFKKNDASKDSLGIGLSIVKGISKLYGFSVNYQYKDQRHEFSLRF